MYIIILLHKLEYLGYEVCAYQSVWTAVGMWEDQTFSAETGLVRLVPNVARHPYIICD